MLKNHIAGLLGENLGHEPTPAQVKFIEIMAGVSFAKKTAKT